MKRRQSGQVLIILFSSLLIGGSGLAAGLVLTGQTASEMRKQAQTIVADPSRADKVNAVLKQWEREVKDIEKTRNKHIDELISALRRHDAAPADFAPIFAAFDDLELRAFDVALAMRFALREQLSPEEWRRMFPSAKSEGPWSRGAGLPASRMPPQGIGAATREGIDADCPICGYQQ